LEALLGCNDFSAELAERYGYINRGLLADELSLLSRSLLTASPSPPHAIAHAKAAVAVGLLVEAHECDLGVAREVTQARVTEALKVGAL
jgi:hypothetical protein